MKKEEKQKLNELRNYQVVKSNDLIQKTRFDLSVQEQKIILYLISQIKPEDKKIKEQEFEIVDFCKICGIDYSNGANYKYIKETLQKLYNKSAWIQTDEAELLFSWLGTVKVLKGKGLVKIKLHEFIEPYLVELRQKFTQYSLYYTLAMKSQYSIRIYELLKSYEYRKHIKIDLEELKKKLDATNYKRFADFRRYVLEIAIREINQFTDIEITYNTELKSRKVEKINFYIKTKDKIDDKLKSWINIENVIDKKIYNEV